MNDKVFVCLVCKREYKFADHHRCLDNGFEQLEYQRQSPDYAHRREYMREYQKRKRALGDTRREDQSKGA